MDSLKRLNGKIVSVQLGEETYKATILRLQDPLPPYLNQLPSYSDVHRIERANRHYYLELQDDEGKKKRIPITASMVKPVKRDGGLILLLELESEVINYEELGKSA